MFRFKKEVDSLLDEYGRTLTLINIKDEKQSSFKAFLQPLRYKNKMYLSSVSTDLCYDSSAKYLLISPIGSNAAEADGYNALISDGTNKYVVDRCEEVYLADEPVYTWAVVSRF